MNIEGDVANSSNCIRPQSNRKERGRQDEGWWPRKGNTLRLLPAILSIVASPYPYRLCLEASSGYLKPLIVSSSIAIVWIVVAERMNSTGWLVEESRATAGPNISLRALLGGEPGLVEETEQEQREKTQEESTERESVGVRVWLLRRYIVGAVHVQNPNTQCTERHSIARPRK